MTDRYERIRAALAMGPTPGPWDGDDNSVSRLWSGGTVGIREYIALPDSADDSAPNPADMHFIAACDPDTIRALLEERDALAKDAARYRWGINNARWIRSEQEAYVAIPVAPDADLSCVAARDAAIGQATGEQS